MTGTVRFGREEHPVLVCAFHEDDARILAAMFSEQAIEHWVCADLDHAAEHLDEAVGAIVLSEEVAAFRSNALQAKLAAQPSWSDVPVIVLGSDDDSRKRQLERTDTAMVIERPLSVRSVLSVTRSALRARRRQFELRDQIAARERAEGLLRQSQKMGTVGELTGGIAHDFNNMLTGVVGALDILRRRLSSGRLEGFERFMDAASASAARAAALTQRLLAFSRRQSLEAQPVAVNALIGNLKELLDRAIDERIVLRLILAPSLPNAIVDPHQLESAILNLAINARDAMPQGGVLTISTRAESPVSDPSGRHLLVEVADSGVGMAPELLEQVFEPFFTTKPVGQGTGLGLSMVHAFAKQSGGEVRIDSELTIGSRVQLFLPTTEAVPTANEDAAVPQSGTGERVLVVEDDEAVLELVRAVLEELNYQAVESRDPLQALPRLASSERIDLLITDVGLPGMNGRQLAAAARRHRPDLPIVFITGYDEHASWRVGLAGDRMATVTKPFTLDTLSAQVRKMIHDNDGQEQRPQVNPR